MEKTEEFLRLDILGNKHFFERYPEISEYQVRKILKKFLEENLSAELAKKSVFCFNKKSKLVDYYCGINVYINCPKVLHSAVCKKFKELEEVEEVPAYVIKDDAYSSGGIALISGFVKEWDLPNNLKPVWYKD